MSKASHPQAAKITEDGYLKHRKDRQAAKQDSRKRPAWSIEPQGLYILCQSRKYLLRVRVLSFSQQNDQYRRFDAKLARGGRRKLSAQVKGATDALIPATPRRTIAAWREACGMEKRPGTTGKGGIRAHDRRLGRIREKWKWMERADSPAETWPRKLTLHTFDELSSSFQVCGLRRRDFCGWRDGGAAEPPFHFSPRPRTSEQAEPLTRRQTNLVRVQSCERGY